MLKTGPIKDRLPRRQAISCRGTLQGVFTPWLKIPYTSFVGFYIPIQWTYHGPGSFLWFSDIALIATMIALWFESRLLASMMALAALLPAVIWNIGFFSRLLGGFDLFGLTAYLFDPSVPWLVRGLSLFQILLPLLLLWMLYRLGYDARALPAQTLFAWAVLILWQALAAPTSDLPWTLGISEDLPLSAVLGWLWLLTLMVAYPVVIYLPTHLLLRALFGNRRPPASLSSGPAVLPKPSN